MQNPIIVTIGGRGRNALDNYQASELTVPVFHIDTDKECPAPREVQSLLLPERAVRAGIPDIKEEQDAAIRGVLQNRDIVFIIAGMGGNTGSVLAPYIARLSKENGAYAVAFAAIPMRFEGASRARKAQEAIEKMKAYTDAMSVTDISSCLEKIPGDRNWGDVLNEIDRGIFDAIQAAAPLDGISMLKEITARAEKILGNS